MRRRGNIKKIDQKTTLQNNTSQNEKDSPPVPISSNLSDNIQQVKEIFSCSDDFVLLTWQYGPDMEHTAFSIYYDTLIQRKELNYMKESLQDLVTHEVGKGTMIAPEEVMSFFEQNGVSAQSHRLVEDFQQVIEKISSGHLIIFFNQWNKALSYKSSNIEGRQVTEPVVEPTVRGPRESTVENIDKNIGMLRNRLQSPHFKIETFSLNGETNTKIAYGYLDGTVNPDMLAEFKRRIRKWREGEILETSYVEELIEDSTYSPFPQYRYTERPDTAVAAMLDGKIVVLVNGSGAIMICPGLLVEFMQSSEDYYQRTVFASLVRLMRVSAFFIALTLPSIYIAFTTFHPELIPTVLLTTIIDSREGIPFPAFIEALLMTALFELLREAGIRLPRPVGSAVSIVGALIIGDAAITAGIASPMMVIVVALTGIASFSMPQHNFAIALRVLGLLIMVFAAILGIFGLLIALILIWLHLADLRSLGQPYLTPLGPFRPKQWRDVFVRAPLKKMFRPHRHRHMRMRPE
ncbi:spore germination protein [Alteribacillus bidgolensis]|uniref:Spore germination protein KA/spore germination protein n=1 Tax=Alteribacillus bidgolensis TaxID=930129 RepID=A0A1G8JK14_9BACI|nr:spore germination protein [Alteribacillus bidgolensis]SDI31535.1 spore germination protein KA/spore germination protein [Alteribacillus bidgolensis]